MRYLRKIAVLLVMFWCSGIVVEAKGGFPSVATVDIKRAIIAAGLAVAAGMIIFLARNGRIIERRGNENDE